MTSRTLGIALLATLLLAAPTAAQELITFPGSCTDVTPDGSVVVGNGPSGGYYWRWQVDPAPVVIGGFAADVSDDGTVIAGIINEEFTGTQVAARWTEATDWVSLDGFSVCGSKSTASDISGDGDTIVGLAWLGCTAHGFRWTPSAGMELLENLGNGTNRASAVSGDGLSIGGFAQGNFDRTPAEWTPDTFGSLWDIDDIGEVLGYSHDGGLQVGTYVFSGFDRTAYLNVVGAGLLDLGKLNSGSGWQGEAFDVSEDGNVVVGSDVNGLARQAWVWRLSDGIISLQDRLTTLGISNVPALERAVACSDSGNTVVGWYYAPPFTQTAYIAVLDDEPWTQAGQGLAGSNGTPVLSGKGTLVDNSDTELNLTHGRSNGTATLIVGLSPLFAPFKQGVLVPALDVLLFGLPLDNDGELLGSFLWPTGAPSGFSFYWQYWISDPAGPAGFSSSNGLISTIPPIPRDTAQSAARATPPGTPR